jgi:hypothetical protein
MNQRFRAICHALGMLKHSSLRDTARHSEVFTANESVYVADWDEDDDRGDGSDDGGVYSARGDAGTSSGTNDLLDMGEEAGDDRGESDEEDEDGEAGLPIRLQHLAIHPRYVSHPHFQGRLFVHEQC